MSETQVQRVKRLYDGHLARGRDPRNAVQRVILSMRTKTSRPTTKEIEALLLEVGVELPERMDGHTGTADPALRAKEVYERRLRKGMADGYALSDAARSLHLSTDECRALLATLGIVPKPGLLGFQKPGLRERVAPKGGRYPQAPKPKPILAKSQAVRIVASYRDESPCVMPDPRELLNQHRSKGEQYGGFKSAREIFHAAASTYGGAR